MKRITYAMAAGLVAALLGACAEAPPPNSAMLTYQTEPAGARIIEGQQDLGVAPIMRTYAADAKSGSITTPDVTAVWPSGAKTSYFTVLPVGADRVATLTRPDGAPGLDVDLANAKRLADEAAADARRRKEDEARDIARSSDRCKAQQSKGGTPAVDNCN